MPVHKKVAIVGTGPAGRMAARQLAAAAVRVTMFDKESAAGGLMRYGYPDFRMPDAVTQRDADELRQRGVSLRFRQELGRDLQLAELERDYDAVLLAIGSAVPRRLAIPGEDLPGVYDALGYLHATRDGHPRPIGRRVLIVGGGDTSMDAATTSRQAGAEEVTVITRDALGDLRALLHEVEFARARGVTIRGQTTLAAIAAVPAGERSALQLTLRDHDKGLTGQETWDTVIVAIGQQRNLKLLQKLGVTPADDSHTDHAKVFLAGETVYGSNRLAKAIVDGRRAAQQVLEFLS